MHALVFNINVAKYIFLKIMGLVNKKIFYMGPFATIKLNEIKSPTPPNDDWALIRVISCGFCGSDLNLIFLKDSPMASPFTSFPCVIGHEICGEVIEFNGDHNEINVGDIVAIAPQLNCDTRGISPPCIPCSIGRTSSCENFAKGNISPGMFIGICKDINGGFAKYVIAHKSQLFKIPKEIEPHLGALVEPTSVAIQTILDNKPKDKEKILIIGLGVIGNLILQCIRAFEIDCEIYGIEPSNYHQDLAKQNLINGIIPYDDIFTHVGKITNSTAYKPMIGNKMLMGGFHRVFDTVGNSKTIDLSLRLLKTKGTLSVVGISPHVKFDTTPLWLKQQKIVGVFGSSYNLINGSKKHAFQIAIDFIARDRIKTKALITHKFKLKEYVDMIETNLNKKKTKALKTIVYF